MKQVVNIVGLAFTVIFAIVIFYYAEEVSDAKMDSFLNSLSSSYSDIGYSFSDSYLDDELTEEAGWISLIFIAFFTFQFIFNLMKVKTKTSKIISIIGISLSGIWLAWDLLMISSPGALSFDEIGPGFLFYALAVLAFSIVGLIQVGVYDRKYANVAVSTSGSMDDILDM